MLHYDCIPKPNLNSRMTQQKIVILTYHSFITVYSCQTPSQCFLMECHLYIISTFTAMQAHLYGRIRKMRHVMTYTLCRALGTKGSGPSLLKDNSQQGHIIHTNLE